MASLDDAIKEAEAYLAQQQAGREEFDFSTAQPVAEEFDFATAQPSVPTPQSVSQPSLPQRLLQGVGNAALMATTPINPFALPIVLGRQIARIPEPVVVPALTIGGGVAGQATGLPFGASLGAGAGATLGELELGRRRLMARQPVVPREILRKALGTGAGTAAGTLAFAGVGKGLTALTGGIKALRTAHNVPLRAEFMRSVRQSFLQSKKLAGEAFGTQLDELAKAHPSQTVDLSDVVGRIQERTLNNPAFKSMLSRSALNSRESTLVQSIINKPEVATTLTMREAQSLKQVLGRMLKQKFQQVGPELTDAHLDAVEAYHGIRAAQLSAFPDFADIAAQYHRTLNNFRMVKPSLTPAALEPAVLSKFGNRAELQEAVRELLPKETVAELTRFIRASQFPRRLRTAVGLGVGGLTIQEIIRRTVGSR